MWADRKSGRGGLPLNSFSPGSFSIVIPPENPPEVNLYFVRIFHAEPKEEVSLLPDFREKFDIIEFLHRTESELLTNLFSRVMNGIIISAVSLSNPGIAASSYTDTICPVE